MEASKLVTSWLLGTGVDHQQVGGTWTEGDDIVSLSLSSDLNIFDKRVGDKPSRIIRVGLSPESRSSVITPCLWQAPQKAVTAALPTKSGTFLTGMADGRLLSFSATGEVSPVGGDGHLSLVTSLSSGKDGKVFSTGFDDCLREIDGPTFTFVGHQISMFSSLTFFQACLTLNKVPTEIYCSWRGWICVSGRDQWSRGGSG